MKAVIVFFINRLTATATATATTTTTTTSSLNRDHSYPV